MSDIGLTSVILLFNGGSFTNDTYYFDNLYGPEFQSSANTLQCIFTGGRLSSSTISVFFIA